jgi:hypothetical protein
MLDAEAGIEREKEEMKKLDQKFEERTCKIAQMVGIQHSGHNLLQGEGKKGSKPLVVEKQSSRVADKDFRIQVKAGARKNKANELGNDANPFSIFNKFQSSHFVHVAQSYGIELDNDDISMVEVISTMEAQEKAHAMLNEARIRKEREIQVGRDENKQLMIIEGGNDEVVESSSEGSIERVPRSKRVTVRRRRQGRGVPRNHESSLLECEGVGWQKKKRSTERVDW